MEQCLGRGRDLQFHLLCNCNSASLRVKVCIIYIEDRRSLLQFSFVTSFIARDCRSRFPLNLFCFRWEFTLQAGKEPKVTDSRCNEFDFVRLPTARERQKLSKYRNAKITHKTEVKCKATCTYFFFSVYPSYNNYKASDL